MQALVLEGVGQPLQLQTVDDPKAGAGEAVVILEAAALNHRDLWIQKGQYAGLKFPIIPGSDGCGKVLAVGDGVEKSWIGQRVIINPALDWGGQGAAQAARFRILGLPDHGTFAERVIAPAANLTVAPAHLDAMHAAALPLTGLTAFRALFSRARLQAGERALITGVGGGAALAGLQFALAAGAEVYVTSGSDAKLARARELGAAGGVNYRQPEWANTLKTLAGGEGFDVILDSAGGEGFGELIELAAPGGRIVFFGATCGNPPGLDLRRAFWKQLSILGTTMGAPTEFAAMVRFVEEQGITPVADTVFPLAEGNAALAAMEAAEQFGKIMLTITAATPRAP